MCVSLSVCVCVWARDQGKRNRSRTDAASSVVLGLAVTGEPDGAGLRVDVGQQQHDPPRDVAVDAVRRDLSVPVQQLHACSAVVV